MKKIKFSHIYEKMPNYTDSPPRSAILLEVVKINSEELHQRFVEYDTIYFDKEENNWCHYKLPKGEVLILILKSEFDGLIDLWTTIRRFTPQKYEYYKNLRGEEFEIEITHKV